VNTTVDDDVARYAAAVRAAFADLPTPTAELLLEDLEDHLQEVAAEAGGPLEERLGAPAAYAAELRASAGLPAPGSTRRRARSRLRDSRLAGRLERSWAAAMAHPAGRAVVGLLPELRPAWWVLRGYLAVQLASVALSYLLADNGLSFPVPQLLGSRVLGLLAVAAAVAGSVALGRRGPTTCRGRPLALVGNAALGLFACVLFTDLGATRYAAEAYHDQYQYEQSQATYPEPASGLRAPTAARSATSSRSTPRASRCRACTWSTRTATRWSRPTRTPRSWRCGCRSTGTATRSATATRRSSTCSTR
jgi:hypothetical protein